MDGCCEVVLSRWVGEREGRGSDGAGVGLGWGIRGGAGVGQGWGGWGTKGHGACTHAHVVWPFRCTHACKHVHPAWPGPSSSPSARRLGLYRADAHMHACTHVCPASSPPPLPAGWGSTGRTRTCTHARTCAKPPPPPLPAGWGSTGRTTHPRLVHPTAHPRWVSGSPVDVDSRATPGGQLCSRGSRATAPACSPHAPCALATR
jgi:hypothetical protein